MAINHLNLNEIDQEQASYLAKFNIQCNGNMLLLGKSGVGKSEILINSIKESNYKVNYINLSVLERTDLAGFPNINNTEDTISFKNPYFLPPLKSNGEVDTVLLFDEVDKASPELMAPLLEILQFKKLNNKPLNIAAIFLTGNLMEERAYSNQISSALLDRCSKYILKFSFEKWNEWARLNNINDLILGFLKSNQNYACGKVENDTYASPSPRSWTLASKALDKALKLKITDVETITNIVSGFVGFEVAIKFEIWYRFFRHYENHIISLIELGNLNFDWFALAPSDKLIFVISACYHSKLKTLDGKKNKFLYLENLCDFFEKYKIDREVQLVGLTNSFDFDFIQKQKLYTNKKFFDTYTKITQAIKK